MIFTDPQSWMAWSIGFLLVVAFYLLCLAAVDQQSGIVRRVFAPTLFEAWSDQLEMFPGLIKVYQPERQRTARAELIAEDPGPALIGEVRQYQRFTPEAETLYAAVLHLRRKGHSVTRRGEQSHVIDGQQVSHVELIRRARGEA